MKVLLLSNSGEPIYGWCKKDIASFCADNKELTFISAATVYSPKEYFEKAKKSLEEVGLNLTHLILDKNPIEQVNDAKAFIVGGGNTYQLIKKLSENNLLNVIKKKVLGGVPYIGLSAGANIAGPNILTTNDWNVSGSTHFDGLNIVSFNINPHYNAPKDKVLSSAETRDERIREYLVFNKNPVVALKEQTLLRVENNKIEVEGTGKAKVFLADQEPKEFKSGEILSLI